MNDIALEVIRIIPVFVIFMYLLSKGKDLHQNKGGWSFIIFGFGLLLFATIVDLTDNFESLNKYIIIGDTQTQAFLEKVVGYLGGFLFLAIGFIQWIPKIVALNQTQQELKDSEKKLKGLNTKLEKKVKERTSELERSKENLEKSKKNLEAKNVNLEKFNKMITGRELKMIELKKELKNKKI